MPVPTSRVLAWPLRSLDTGSYSRITLAKMATGHTKQQTLDHCARLNEMVLQDIAKLPRYGGSTNALP